MKPILLVQPSGATMDVGDFLRELGLQQYEAAFRDNRINIRVLPQLTRPEGHECHDDRTKADDRSSTQRWLAASRPSKRRCLFNVMCNGAAWAIGQNYCAELLPISRIEGFAPRRERHV
jgi:hypothetical protein